MPTAEVQLALAGIALLAGVGITAIGPGGILLTIALYALLPISPPIIAGTASATFVAAGLLGCWTYRRSGELAHPENRGLAWWLSGTSMAGAGLGTLVNPLFPRATFGALLGLATILAGGLVLVQLASKRGSPAPVGSGARPGRGTVAGLGVGLGFACSLLGVGGPVFAVPALIVVGLPMLTAVAVAQVQSVFISGFATLGYAAQGAVSWRLALLVGVPQLIGALAGWWVAQRTEPARLTGVLGIVLILLGVFLLV